MTIFCQIEAPILTGQLRLIHDPVVVVVEQVKQSAEHEPPPVQAWNNLTEKLRQNRPFAVKLRYRFDRTQPCHFSEKFDRNPPSKSHYSVK